MTAVSQQVQQLHTSKVSSKELSHLKFGTKLTVQATGAYPMRFNAELVGMQLGKYLILRLPEVSEWRTVKTTITDRETLIIRGIMGGQGGSCFAFRSVLHCFMSVPVSLMFLTFPRDIEKCELRRYPRVNTCILASLTELLHTEGLSDNLNLPGLISDVSLGGCCFDFEKPEKVKGVNKKQVSVKVAISDNQQPIKLNGIIKNTREIDTSLRVGIQFMQNASAAEGLLKRLMIHPGQLRAH